MMCAAACAKHYAVHSGPDGLRHEFDAIASPKDLEETYLPHFKALVEAGIKGVMDAYNRVNGEGTCASEFLMGKLKNGALTAILCLTIAHWRIFIPSMA